MIIGKQKRLGPLGTAALVGAAVVVLLGVLWTISETGDAKPGDRRIP